MHWGSSSAGDLSNDWQTAWPRASRSTHCSVFATFLSDPSCPRGDCRTGQIPFESLEEWVAETAFEVEVLEETDGEIDIVDTGRVG